MARLGKILFLGAFFGLLGMDSMLRLAGLRYADDMAKADVDFSAEDQAGGGQVPEFISAWQRSFEEHLTLKLPAKIFDSSFRYRWLHSSSDDRVRLGRQGWLFTPRLRHAGEQDMERDFSGKSTLTNREVEFNAALLKARSDKFKAQHILYFVVIVPDKQTLYPEFLPPWLRTSPNTGRLRFLRVAAKSGLDVLDLVPALLRAKRQGQVFMSTDTHWNLWGAQAAYAAILEHWARLPGLQQAAAPEPARPYAWESLHVRKRPYLGGDLSYLLGLQSILTEPADWLKVPGFEGMIFSRFPIMPPKPETLACHQGDKLLFFGDSYSVFLTPLLRRHAAKAGFFDNRQSFPEAEILAAKPKIVIEEFAERRFAQFPLVQGDPQGWLQDAQAEGLRAALLGL